MKFVYWGGAGVLCVFAVLFALSNRQTIAFEVFPLPFVVEVPAYIFGLGAFAIGVLCGGFVISLRLMAVRARARRSVRRAESLQRELDSLRGREPDEGVQAAPASAIVTVPDGTSPPPHSAGLG